MDEWGFKDVDTFWTSWKMACCPIWCSLTRRNMTLSSASTIKTTVFGVAMHPWKAEEWVDARVQLLLRFGRPSQPLEGHSLVFVPSGVKLNSQRYISDILEGELLAWAREHFEGAPWTFQQDSASLHGSRMTQRWIQAHIPPFISKEDWPSRNPDINPLDFLVWSILESKACRTSHYSLENLKAKLQREWALTPKKFCVPCAMPFKGDWSKLLKIKNAILNKWQMNSFAMYLAISCCNKFSIFFVFIREPGQNVRCHKFGGPCTVNTYIVKKLPTIKVCLFIFVKISYNAIVLLPNVIKSY